MAWTAKVTDVGIDGGNCFAVVTFTDEARGKQFTDKTFGDNLTLEGLKNWAAVRIESLSSRDSAEETLKLLVGQNLTPEKTEVDPEFAAFRLALARLAAYRRVRSEVAEISNAEKAALAVVESYLVSNPAAIDVV